MNIIGRKKWENAKKQYEQILEHNRLKPSHNMVDATLHSHLIQYTYIIYTYISYVHMITIIQIKFKVHECYHSKYYHPHVAKHIHY